MTVNKKDIVHLLETIAIYMELKGENTFKVSAFRKAAQALELIPITLEEITDYLIPGIGKGTAAVIEEYRIEGNSTVLKRVTR